ncbi:MAG: DUF554 domain-containing protein [Verrucomicrobia bacterium]|nr:DUF554 domain-containing protein [Verrucomicrobiota bacterium]
MIGTILNGTAILVGGIAGLTVSKDLSLANQSRLKIALGVFVVYAGLSSVWSGLNGTFSQVMKQIGIITLAFILGNLTGKLLRLQKSFNKLGQDARERFSRARPADPNRVSEGFITCSLVFCVAPMAILGALQDGLADDFKTLAIKSVMDGLATMAFARTFGWGVILSVIPVVSYQGTITLAAKAIHPLLRDHAIVDSVTTTGGLLVCCLALIVLDLKKVRVADYLPTLVFAPLLTWIWR